MACKCGAAYTPNEKDYDAMTRQLAHYYAMKEQRRCHLCGNKKPCKRHILYRRKRNREEYRREHGIPLKARIKKTGRPRIV